MTDPKWPISKATDTPPTDEAEVEGHGFRIPVTEQPSDDPETDAEVDGHGFKIGN